MAKIIDFTAHLARKQSCTITDNESQLVERVTNLILEKLSDALDVERLANPNIGRRIEFYNRICTIVAEDERYFTVIAHNFDAYGAKVQKITSRCVREYASTITHWAYPDRDYNKATSLEIKQYQAEAEIAENARLADEMKAKKEAFSLQVASKELWNKHCPEWARAVIIAEYVEDQSDSMTDYFASTTKRTVLLAWSKNTRDLFKEMRKAAALFPETADLATAPESAEHREKYSMGGGYYLKNGWRHHTGWRIKKVPFYNGNRPTFTADFSIIAK